MYVSGLPEDISDDEYLEYMKKAGMIKENDDGSPKCKLYRDQEGRPKGDAKCCYLKEASIDIAINILDGAEIRPGHKVKVEKDKFEQKGDSYVAWKPKAKKKKTKNAAPKQDSSLGWEDFRTDAGAKILIIKNVFDPKESAGTEGFPDDLRDDIEAECVKKAGEVDKVTVFALHPEGVVAVKFKAPESAEKMRVVMDGRWFSQRQLEALLYDGKTDYSLGTRRETVEDQQKRLESFGSWLEGDEEGGKKEPAAAK